MEWIKCSDRLPENYEKVICWDGETQITATHNDGLFFQDIEYCFSLTAVDNVIDNAITHWMPLPKPPEDLE